MSDPSCGEEELASLRRAANIAEEAARWLRSSLSRVRDGKDLDLEAHNAAQALEAALARIKETRES
jgi:hypothetical protein